jgi:hypothetical protein
MLLEAGADPAVCSDRETVLTQALSLVEQPNIVLGAPRYSDAAIMTWSGDIIDSIICRPQEDAAVASHSAVDVGKLRRTDEEAKSRDDDSRAFKRVRR